MAIAIACVVIGTLGACADLRTAQHSNTREASAGTQAETTREPPTGAAGPTADSNTDFRPPEPATATPPCACAEAKFKPRPKPRVKPVHKEMPSHSPATIPQRLGESVSDAHVRPMPVSVMSILGKRVQGAKGEDLGRVVDVLADASGRVRIAIIDFGGFLGVGNHRIAVEWPLLHFNPDTAASALLLSLSAEQLRAAPEYKDIPRPQTLMEPAPPSSPAAAPAPDATK